MRSRSVGCVRKGLLVSLVAACFVLSGAWAEAARAREAKDPAAKRDRKGGQAAGDRRKGGPTGVIRLASLNAKALQELHGKLDADSSGSVSLEEFKALPKVLKEMAKEAAEKTKARRGKKAGGGATDPAKKRKGGRKKKDAGNQ